MSGKHSRKRTRASRYTVVVVAIVLAAAVAVGALYLLDHGWASSDRRTADASTISESSTAATGGAATKASAATSTTSTPTTSTTSTTSATSTSTTVARDFITVAAGGDVMGDRGVGAFLDKDGGPAVFAQVKPYLDKADVAFVNLEGPVSDKGTRAVGKEVTFRARPALIDGLASAGVDVVSQANNHSLDYGSTALLDTILRLGTVGIAHAGAGANDKAAAAPALLETPAGTVAVLAFTDIIPGGFPAGPAHAGVNPASPDRDKVLASIRAAKAEADYVIVSFHWGIEYTGEADQDQRDLAHAAIDAGADLVLGHHPHVIQGLELYRGKLIVYSLGDFVFDHYSQATGETFILELVLPAQGSPKFEIVPVYVNDTTGVPAPVTGKAADSILTRLTALSANLGLQLAREGDRAAFFGTT